MNKTPFFIILIVLAILGYMGYGYIDQKSKDDQFQTACEKNPNIHTFLTFAVKQTENSNQIDVQLKDNKGKIILNKILYDTQEVNEFKYEGSFSVQDTIKLVYNKKVYKIYGFRHHSVVINEKKGPECQYKGAFINGKWNEGTVFDLN
ncbi:hypothetical protein [Pedobacter punctiformis]|uniref:Uncharacterized protein n=1 Tax=Pedobacter punctiformis TaxID=3004097 RepID=A0ABT4L7F0_9SPHI|nr:hypothetical protein [Pedobacter sp. HCMS5-2]MCZ4243838.1 hypothetical protein [Pedobacter sp. HCMS5-2]